MSAADLVAIYLAKTNGDANAALLALAEAALRIEQERDAYADRVSAGLIRRAKLR